MGSFRLKFRLGSQMHSEIEEGHRQDPKMNLEELSWTFATNRYGDGLGRFASFLQTSKEVLLVRFEQFVSERIGVGDIQEEVSGSI